MLPIAQGTRAFLVSLKTFNDLQKITIQLMLCFWLEEMRYQFMHTELSSWLGAKVFKRQREESCAEYLAVLLPLQLQELQLLCDCHSFRVIPLNSLFYMFTLAQLCFKTVQYLKCLRLHKTWELRS